MAVKNIALSSSDFIGIREGDCYYVDKSMLIANILRRDNMGISLFARPRRFGKTLNLNMLDAFFNIEYKDRSAGWFEDLKIAREPEYAEYRASCPVVKISFKDVSSSSYDCFLGYVYEMFSSVLLRCRHVLEANDGCRASLGTLDRIFKEPVNESSLAYFLPTLMQALSERYGAKVVLLIDEYDGPLNDTFGTDCFPKVKAFMRRLFGLALKDNPLLRIAVLTGIMQVSKESIFSGLNNLYVDSIMSDSNSEMFGFTSDEVLSMCRDYGNPEAFETARSWYDGYRFGNSDMYNPLSVASFVSSGFRPGSYWVGTSGNSILDSLIGSADPQVYQDLDVLCSGDSIDEAVRMNLSYDELSSSRKGLYSFMVMTGYLNAVQKTGGMFRLSIPNYEVGCEFDGKIRGHMNPDGWGGTFLGFALCGDAVTMGRILESTLKDIMSARVRWSPETYQAVVAMLARASSNKFVVVSDREYGDGFCDVRVENPCKNGPHVVFEVKSTSDSKADLTRLSKECILQIHDRRYYEGLEGGVLLYGIAFCGKKFVVSVDDSLSNTLVKGESFDSSDF